MASAVPLYQVDGLFRTPSDCNMANCLFLHESLFSISYKVIYMDIVSRGEFDKNSLVISGMISPSIVNRTSPSLICEHKVMLHGEFNQFEGQGMEEDQAQRPSVHKTTLLLSPGKYKYYFAMDGHRRSAEEVDINL